MREGLDIGSDAGQKFEGQYGIFNAKDYGIENETLIKGINGYANFATLLGGRPIMAMDEVFKLLGYRAELYAQGYRTMAKSNRKAIQDGLTPEEADKIGLDAMGQLLSNPPKEIDDLVELERQYHAAEDGIPKLSAGITWLMTLVKSDPERARGIAHEILRESAAIGYRQDEGYAHLVIGRTHDLSTEFESARQEFGSALEIFIETDESVGHGKALYLIAESYDHQSNYDIATAQYVNAVKFLELHDIPQCQHTLCLTLNGLGIVYCRLADYTDGLACFYRAIEIEKIHQNPGIRTQLYANISTAFMHVGDVSVALDNYNKALELADSNKDERTTAIIRTNIGSIYFHFRDYPSAMAHYLQALQLWHRYFCSSIHL